MRTHTRILPLLTFILFLPIFFPLFAQETDNALWTTIDIKKKFIHGLALSFEEEYKMRENFSNTDKFETTIDLSWKPLSFLKGGIAYCRIDYNHPLNLKHNHPTEYWELRHRYIAYLTGTYDIGRFNLSLKEKFQQTYRMDVDSTKSDPINILRSKFEVSYNIKGIPLTPYTNIELFYSLNEPNGKYPSTTEMFSETRSSVGLEYSLLKNLDIEAGYLYCAEKGWDEDVRDINGHKVGGFVSGFTNALTLGLSYTF
ncbi:MAG TPA: DUF2490 domain-containing protein [Bacteroidales bacterium]